MEQSWNELIGANFDLTYRKGIASISNKMSYDYYKQEDPIVSFADFAKANPYYRKDAGNGKIERYLIDMDTYSGVYRRLRMRPDLPCHGSGCTDRKNPVYTDCTLPVCV